jgi:hypothetical protein
MSDGGRLVTKGLVGGGGSVTPTPAEAPLAPPPSEPAQLESATPHGTVMIVVPTAVNVVLMTSENIVDNLKTRNAASLELPSLYKRAYLIAHETDEIAVAKEQ